MRGERWGVMNNIIDGDAVMQQVQQGTAPSYWFVCPARVSQFLKNIAVFAVFSLLLIGGLRYLQVNPGFAIGLRGAGDIPELHALWRRIDFGVAGIVLLMLLFFLVSGVRNLATARQQALVLLPEGFVMQKGATRKTMVVIHYGAISEITTSVSNYTLSLVMPRTDGYGTIRVELDGRFGPSDAIAELLQQAHRQYAMGRY